MKLYKVKKSKIDNKGRGLYATKDIKSGTKIIDYVGKILTNKFTKGKVVSILEGGYDLNALAESANEHVNALVEFN